MRSIQQIKVRKKVNAKLKLKIQIKNKKRKTKRNFYIMVLYLIERADRQC